MNRTVLVVDDEPKIRRLVESYLATAGFRVVTTGDGREVLSLVRKESPDLVVLDLMLPGLDGLEITRRLRQEGSIPIIMLTARVDESDRVVGLELGADDYVLKPFSPKELVARVRAVLRRTKPGEDRDSDGRELIQVHDLVLDPVRRRFTQSGSDRDLTSYQFDLLAVLAASPGRVFSRSRLVELVRSDAFEGYDRTVDAHIKNIRKVLRDSPSSPRYIETVRGVGYRMKE